MTGTGRLRANAVRCGLACAALAAAWGVWADAADGAEDPPRPNIVFLLCDDLGYGDLGCYGHPSIKTPHLDRLAQDGLKLNACYAPAPVCSPSRAGFLTGQHPHRNNIRDWIPPGTGICLPKTAPSAARSLKEVGYATAHVGKWHLSSTLDGSEPTPADFGFDHWFSTQNNAAPSHQDPDNFVRNGKPAGPLRGHATTLVVDEALGWLKTVPADQPFALFVWFHAPHEPVATPDREREPYAAAGADRSVYYGSVSLIDAQVGRLLAVLDERGVRGDTLVFFTSDNGPETLLRYRAARFSYGSAGSLRGMKLWMTEGGYRVPGILCWPARIKAGQTSDVPVCGVDLLPTLCELAGAELPAGVPWDGTSLVPLWEGRELKREVPLYWQYDRAIGGPYRMALRRGPWKLLSDAPRKNFQLFHLEDDPGERNDRSKAQPELVQELAKELQSRYESVNAGAAP